MGYFNELPEIAYQSPLSHKNSSRDYVIIKNIFRRVKLLDYLKDATSLFNKFIIGDGDRPDTVAEILYGDSRLDYVLGNKKTVAPVYEEEDTDRGEAEELVTAAVSTTPSSVNEDDDDALSYFQKLAEE